ncbi:MULTISPECIES: acetoacetate--CoA ligase [unclassified Sphingobacterium]|uniref:acetoacetate--CoA ligase n=1 Tax=unclassified Sphingobacterium TaxID=2609468 RepID=UPI002600C2CB|nr:MULTISPECIES: acetoacetate--CoA ligase [unclassified Sphingobacterium]
MGKLLWSPTEEQKSQSEINKFKQYIEKEYGLCFSSYQELWAWSTTDLSNFWKSIATYFNLAFHSDFTNIIELPADSTSFIGTKWFAGATLNYAEHVFRKASEQRPALIFQSEQQVRREVSWLELEFIVLKLQIYLKEIGVQSGDRVAGVLINGIEAVALFLATNSIGAVWSCCSPDFGEASIQDRFEQIEPKVLFANSSYSYNGRHFEKSENIKQLAEQLPSLLACVFIDDNIWEGIMGKDVNQHKLQFTAVPFDSPIWILYSSGTTGKPKAITHGVGGMLLEHVKAVGLHQNVQNGERFMWYSTTGWMMWNYALSALLMGNTLCIYDGATNYPDKLSLWKFAQENKVDHFGVGAAYLISCQDQDLRSLSYQPKTIGSTGSPLPPDVFEWLNEQFPKSQIISLSGGTDVCSAFLSGCALRDVYAGEIQCRALGAKIEAFDVDGHNLYKEVGELVILAPMPCMPIYFWNDPANKKYFNSYFDKYPGVWNHGDWIQITSHDGVIMYGRSDATLNRGGVRIGTAEIYNVLNKTEGVLDSLVVCVDHENGSSDMLLFVQLNDSLLSDALKGDIKRALRQQYSPRHVPDYIFQVAAIPYTLSGKKLELPVKKIFSGMAIEKAVSVDIMRNPECLSDFEELSKTWKQH